MAVTAGVATSQGINKSAKDIAASGASNARQVKGPPNLKSNKDKKGNLYGVEGAQEMDSQVQEHVKGTLDGSIKRYDDATIAQMKQGLFETTRGQASQSKRNLRSELARSGALRSGAMARGGMEIDNAAASSYTQGVRDIMLEKAKAEFEDKQVAIQQAQAYLQQKQDYDLGIKQMQTTLSAASIQAGATVAAAKLGADASRAAAGAAAGAAKYAAGLNFQVGMANVQNTADSLQLQAASLGLNIR